MKYLYRLLLIVSGLILTQAVGIEKPGRQMEDLDRGIVAIRSNPEEVFISWRLLGTDPEKTGFNLYRGSLKLNNKLLTQSTNFIDKTTTNDVYSVKAVIRSKELKESDTCYVRSQNYFRIPLNRPLPGTVKGEVVRPSRALGAQRTRPGDSLARSGRPAYIPPGYQSGDPPVGPRQYNYSPGDGSVADLDGDGQYEIVLKWDPSNARDNAQDGFTGNVILDAYELDGKQLWRINLGTNIRAGAHYTQFLVYDFDGDGRAEIACKTADGTIDGKGKPIGNADADYVNEVGRIVSGPEYLTVFDGSTGAALETVDYVPGRGDICAWGANECRANRSDRFLACVAYLDGIHPSPVFCRGYYGRLTIAAWDWRDSKLSLKWFFDSDKGYPEYMGQGNHNLSVGDIDGDGRDEIVYGSSAYDDNGKPLYTTGMGHGDAMHLSDLDPDLPGLEVWAVKETGGWGSVMHSAGDGKILLRIPDSSDVGRGNAADIYPEHRGFELWSSATKGVYNVKGEKITNATPSINFRIYWDGDLQDELLDRTFIDDWDHVGHKPVRLLDAAQYGGSSINGTKATPVVSADLLGDWREEVIFRGKDNSSLLLFTTTIPTDCRMVTLMHDPVYHLGVAWQNVVYNQPPHPGYYIGESDKKKYEEVRTKNKRIVK